MQTFPNDSDVTEGVITTRSNRMKFRLDDITKIKFLKLWDLLGYFERTTSERLTCQKLALWAKYYCLEDTSPILPR